MIRERNHIFKMMTFLFKLWLKYPSLRFCQLIQNAFRTSWTIDGKTHYDQGKDIYYIEDDEFIKQLKITYKEGLKNDKEIG